MSVLQNLQWEPFKTGLRKNLSDMMLREMDSILEQETNWKISLWHYSVLWFAESEITGGFILEKAKVFRQFLTGCTELLFISLSTARDTPTPRRAQDSLGLWLPLTVGTAFLPQDTKPSICYPLSLSNGKVWLCGSKCDNKPEARWLGEVQNRYSSRAFSVTSKPGAVWFILNPHTHCNSQNRKMQKCI